MWYDGLVRMPWCFVGHDVLLLLFRESFLYLFTNACLFPNVFLVVHGTTAATMCDHVSVVALLLSRGADASNKVHLLLIGASSVTGSEDAGHTRVIVLPFDTSGASLEAHSSTIAHIMQDVDGLTAPQLASSAECTALFQ
eukprot:m.1389230 g.1389230  ORF g.1389230 m.1389230 type:complete len:140 (-) comp24987_c0_seq59:2993-3412(-)